MPDDKLTEAVRALIRQELQQPPKEAAPEVAPRPSDAAWLLLTIANAVLLLSLVPSDWFKNPLVGLLEKLVPWLCSGLFLVGYTWFRDRLLGFTRTRGFKAVLLSACPALLMVHVTSHVPVFALRLQVEPDEPGLSILVDGETADPADLWLYLGGHKIEVQSSRSGTAGREIEIDSSDLWRGMFGLFPAEIDCALLRDFRFMRSESGQDSYLRIKRLDRRFDRTFRADLARNKFKEVRSSTLSFLFPAGVVVVRAKLPVGRYEVRAERPGCQISEPTTFRIGPEGGTMVLVQEPRCPA